MKGSFCLTVWGDMVHHDGMSVKCLTEPHPQSWTREREMNAYIQIGSPPCFFFIKSLILACGMVLPIFRAVLPASTNSIERFACRLAQRFVSMATLNPLKLTTKIKCHACHSNKIYISMKWSDNSSQKNDVLKSMHTFQMRLDIKYETWKKTCCIIMVISVSFSFWYQLISVW